MARTLDLETDPWLVIDPAFADPAQRQVAHAVLDTVMSGWNDAAPIDPTEPLDTVMSGWNDAVPIDPTEPVVRAVLSKHRIAALVPIDAVPAHAQQSFVEELQNAQATQMRIQASARAACQTLTSAGIDHRILKGMASTFLDYPRPELRLTGDADILVAVDQHEAAIEALTATGARPHPYAPRNPHMAKGATLRTHLGIEIDLHTRLTVRRGETNMAMSDPGVPVPQVASTALPLELRLVHAAAHLIGSPPGYRRMSGLIDLVLLLDAEPDPDKTLAWAKRADLAARVAAAVRLADTLTNRTSLPLDDWPQLRGLERALLLAPQRRWGVEYLYRMVPLPWPDRVRYLPIWLTPSRRTIRRALTDIRHRRRNG